MASGSLPTFENPDVEKGATALAVAVYHALRREDISQARALVKGALADPQWRSLLFAPDRHGTSAFRLWADTKRAEVFEMLARCQIPWTPWTAARWGRLDVLRSLCGRSKTFPVDDRGRTPMHAALATGQVDVARWLVSRGLDLPSTEGPGYVREATNDRDPTTVRLAIELGAVVDHPPCGQTALHHEVKHGWRALVPVLLEAGADPNRGDENADTALHLLARRGVGRPVATMLLEAGADPMIENRGGETPLDLARKARRKTLAAFLEEWEREN